MTKDAATVIGFILGGFVVGALGYWFSGGDLLVTGGIVVFCLIGGAYTLGRGRGPAVPAASPDGSRTEIRTPIDANTPLASTPDSSVGAAVPTSPSVIRLASLLVTEKGYKQLDRDAFGFLGRRFHWGSHAWIGLVDADELDVAGRKRLANRFYHLVFNDISWIGIPAYGILCFVFEGAPSTEVVDHIRGLKKAADPTKGNWMVYWSIVLSTGTVIPHDGAPWRPFPGRAYLEKAIRSGNGR
jgi:hypothetical protein